MIEAMIDIETLDTRPSAIVLSIGCVIFDEQQNSRRGVIFPDLKEQVERGRSISADTVSWWLTQDPAALRGAFEIQRMPVDGCAAWLSEMVNGAMTIWANGPAFDCVILEDLFRGRHLWKFYQCRDVRTLREEAGVPRDFNPTGLEGLAHDPLYDCEKQIAVIREARWRLSQRQPASA